MLVLDVIKSNFLHESTSDYMFFIRSLMIERLQSTVFLFVYQVASQETYGTLGAIVRSQTGNRQVGFLTNRHVAVDLDYPNQKMFHPLPPTLGPGVYLGAVERATSFITDELWYGIFAGINPGNELSNYK